MRKLYNLFADFVAEHVVLCAVLGGIFPFINREIALFLMRKGVIDLAAVGDVKILSHLVFSAWAIFIVFVYYDRKRKWF